MMGVPSQSLLPRDRRDGVNSAGKVSAKQMGADGISAGSSAGMLESAPRNQVRHRQPARPR
jgi:hypothetical protein